MDIVDLRLLGVHGDHSRLVAEEAVDLACEQGGRTVRIAVKVQVIAVGEKLRGSVLYQGPHQNAEPFAVIVLPAHRAVRCFRPFAGCAHHGRDLHIEQGIGKRNRFSFFRRVIEVGHDAVHISCFRSRNDTAEIVNLKLDVRAEPGCEAVCKLNVVPAQLCPDVIGIGHHGTGRADSQLGRKMLRQRDLRHGVVGQNHPAHIHIVQRPVRVQLRDESINLFLKVRDGRNGRQPDRDGVFAVVLVQKTNACRSVFYGKLHFTTGIHIGVKPALGNIIIGQRIVVIDQDLRLGIILLQCFELQHVARYADLRTRLAKLVKRGDLLFALCAAAGQHGQRQSQEAGQSCHSSFVPMNHVPLPLFSVPHQCHASTPHGVHHLNDDPAGIVRREIAHIVNAFMGVSVRLV